MTPSVIPVVRSRYSTPLLNATGPALNQVSSLNSSTGEKALLATSGALCAVTPNRTTNSTIPPNHTPKTDRPILRLVLIPCFSAAPLRRHSSARPSRPSPRQAHGERQRVGAKDQNRRGEAVAAAADRARG